MLAERLPDLLLAISSLGVAIYAILIETRVAVAQRYEDSRSNAAAIAASAATKQIYFSYGSGHTHFDISAHSLLIPQLNLRENWWRHPSKAFYWATRNFHWPGTLRTAEPMPLTVWLRRAEKHLGREYSHHARRERIGADSAASDATRANVARIWAYAIRQWRIYRWTRAGVVASILVTFASGVLAVAMIALGG